MKCEVGCIWRRRPDLKAPLLQYGSKIRRKKGNIFSIRAIERYCYPRAHTTLDNRVQWSTLSLNGAVDPTGLATILATVVKLLIETAHALVNLKDKGMHATDETPDHTRARGPATRGGEEKGKTFTGIEVGWREKKRQ